MKTMGNTDAPTSGADTAGLYSTDTLAEAIGVPAERICVWVAQGLLEAATEVEGAHYFNFKQMTAARTLRDLIESGTSLKKLRLGMKRLKKWLPDARPQQRLVAGDAGPLVRVDDDVAAEPDGQLRLEFIADDGAPVPLSALPQTAQGWFDLGTDHYAAGRLDDAVATFRRALQVGGPDARIAFALAHALAESGNHEQAAERYLQVVELDPQDADAWTNLATVLCALDQHEAACDAYRQALEIRPADARAHYNLADALDELGRRDDAAPHWQAYLKCDSTSHWAAHARKRLAAVI